MTKLRPAIAPHKSLPIEILAESFLHYAAEVDERVVPRRVSAYRGLLPFPWVLGQICSRWGQIANLGHRLSFNAIDYGRMLIPNEAFRQGGQSRLWLFTSKDEDEKCIYDGSLRDVVCCQSRRIMELLLFVLATIIEEFLPFPMNFCLCWDQLTHINFSEMSI